MANLKTVKIFPPIGIARLGTGPETFIGPELPFPAAPPVPEDGNYKDTQCRIRRQAQRFRLWGYFDDSTDRELTAADGAIQWTVHVANAKAVFHGEAGAVPIDPGPRVLNGPNASVVFDTGTYTYGGGSASVPLGDAYTDDQGHLIVAGGYGTSGSPNNMPMSGDFWESLGWYDDVSDGPVNAQITVNGNLFNAVGAWVICPPPRFAPGTYSPITLYDLLRQVAITENLPGTPVPAATPSFVNDIWPILTRGIGMTRVDADAFGPGDHGSLATVIPPGPGQDVTRAAIYNKLAPSGDMPLLYSSGGGLGAYPQDGLPYLRDFQLQQMQAWSTGNFTNDWPPTIPTAITPAGLTQAALENCVGAPLFPGIEATVSVNGPLFSSQSLTPPINYVEAFRFDQSTLQPGDVTKGMARPWQADFADCSASGPDSPAWWPAARPDSVYAEGSATPGDWTHGLVSGPQDMVNNWYHFGFVVDPGTGQAVETEYTAVCRNCFIITDQNEIGAEEAQALADKNQPLVDAFHVVVEGFKPKSELGIMTATPNALQLQAWAPNITMSPTPTQMTQLVADMTLEDNNALDQAQRVTFGYNISFTGTADFGPNVNPIELRASIQGVSSLATIDLNPVDAPYMNHGPISYLSDDTRVFIQPGPISIPGAPAIGSDPLGYIKGALAALNADPAAASTFFESMPAGEDATDQLEWNQTVNGQNIYNFALCRVRYRARSTVAHNVRVFFRLFQTAAASTDYNPNTTYKVGGNHTTKVPLLGIQNGELVTIPFFAEQRKPDLNQQTDGNNVNDISPGAQEQEVYMFYGSWLDINQPDLLYPLYPSSANGPFMAADNPLSIHDLIKGEHQCLVTEINFDLEAITPEGISTANSNMLSQRNLAIDNSDNPGSAATHRVQHTFEIHPTTAQPLPAQGPDELMILWGNTPAGTTASIYLPGVRASEVLQLAARSFNLQTLEAVDDHTLQCQTAGVTYVPIPAGVGPDLAGLITLDLPQGIRSGQVFRVVCRQVVDTPAPQPQRPGVVVAPRAVKTGCGQRATVERPPSPSRHVIGAFRFSVLVKKAEQILPGDERTLENLKRVLAQTPVESRWYPVMLRYVAQLEQRITGLGGHQPGPHHGEHCRHYEGKIEALIFDRFGDFEGFWLNTEDGRRRFHSREKAVEELARTAWSRRILVMVTVEKDDRDDPQEIVLMCPSAEI